MEPQTAFTMNPYDPYKGLPHSSLHRMHSATEPLESPTSTSTSTLQCTQNVINRSISHVLNQAVYRPGVQSSLINQSHDQSIHQKHEQNPSYQAMIRPSDVFKHHQSINQSTNQSINQPNFTHPNHSIYRQSINQLAQEMCPEQPFISSRSTSSSINSTDSDEHDLDDMNIRVVNKSNVFSLAHSTNHQFINASLLSQNSQPISNNNQTNNQTVNAVESKSVAEQIAYHRSELARLIASQQDNTDMIQLDGDQPVKQSSNQSTNQSSAPVANPHCLANDESTAYIIDDLSVPENFPHVPLLTQDQMIIDQARVRLSQSMASTCRAPKYAVKRDDFISDTIEHSTKQSINQLNSQSNDPASSLTRLCELALKAFDAVLVQVDIVNTETVDVISRVTVSDIAIGRSDLSADEVARKSITDTMEGLYQAPRLQTYCHFVSLSGKQLIIPDMNSSRTTKNHWICSNFGVNFYAACPLVLTQLDSSNDASNNQSPITIGTFCIMDNKPRPDWNQSNSAILQLFSRSAVNVMELGYLNSRRSAFRQNVCLNVSHELRTPLHSIINEVDTIREFLNHSTCTLSRQSSNETKQPTEQSINPSSYHADEADKNPSPDSGSNADNRFRKTSINQSVNQSISGSVSESINQSVPLDCLTEIETQSFAILSIVNDLFDFLKLESGERRINPSDYESKSFSLVKMINDVIDSFSAVADQEQAVIKLLFNHPIAGDSSQSISQSVNQAISLSTTSRFAGSSQELRQLLSNLLSNSLKFTSTERTPELTVSIDLSSTQPDFHQVHPEYPSYSLHLLKSINQSINQSNNNPSWLYIKVADNGQGIARHRFSHIFDDFFQGAQSNQSATVTSPNNQFDQRTVNQTINRSGVGLGLAIVRLLIGLMGGRLMLESLVGHGTVFHVIVPVRSVQSIAPVSNEADNQTINQSINQSFSPPQTPRGRHFARKSSSITNGNHLLSQSNASGQVAQRPPVSPIRSNQSVKQVIKQSNISPVRILVVDDNAINLKVASRVLQGAGYSHCCVNSGAEALKLIKQSNNQSNNQSISQLVPFDVILCDLQMPEMSGQEVTKLLREFETEQSNNQSNNQTNNGSIKHLIIIAVTASETVVDRNDGFDATVYKPFTRGQLVKVIESQITYRAKMG